MLGEKFNAPAPKPVGPRQTGQTVTNPRALVAIALKNAQGNNPVVTPQSPLAAAISKKKKKSGF